MLQLIGVAIIDDMPAIVSEWMAIGTMNNYLETHEEVNILALVRHSDTLTAYDVSYTGRQVKGIVCELEYLYGVGVVHSDLKGVQSL